VAADTFSGPILDPREKSFDPRNESSFLQKWSICEGFCELAANPDFLQVGLGSKRSAADDLIPAISYDAQ